MNSVDDRVKESMVVRVLPIRVVMIRSIKYKMSPECYQMLTKSVPHFPHTSRGLCFISHTCNVWRAEASWARQSARRVCFSARPLASQKADIHWGSGAGTPARAM